MLVLLISIQLVQLCHTLETKHHRWHHVSEQEQWDSYEVSCTICDYLVNTQSKYALQPAYILLKPVERVWDIPLLRTSYHPFRGHLTLWGNRGPPAT